MFQSLASSLAQLLRTWWRQDRIRVGRSCGQLLSLSVGDRLVIDDSLYMVANRCIINSAELATVHYVERLSSAAQLLHLDPLTDRHHDGDGSHDETVFTSDPAWAAESSPCAMSTCVEYLLCECTDVHEAAWNPLQDADGRSTEEQTQRQVARLPVARLPVARLPVARLIVARLIVPIVERNSIRLSMGASHRELLSEAIVVLPGKKQASML